MSYSASCFDYIIIRNLGEGAFGRVELGRHKHTDDLVAVKIFDSTKMTSGDEYKREVIILRMLNHPNIVKFIDLYESLAPATMQADPATLQKTYFLTMEYASGGELFDIIEPDIGLDRDLSQLYFRQLISAVAYLHEKGVVHRDIKPENILLDHAYNIKLADFGLSTIFKHKGLNRMLNRQCGSFPYVAPEAYHGGDYAAIPLDVWACGIVLLTLLLGILPWDAPTEKYKEYRDFMEDGPQAERDPWNRLAIEQLDLVRRLLRKSPSERPDCPAILRHPFLKKQTWINTRCGPTGLLPPMAFSHDSFIRVINAHQRHAHRTQTFRKANKGISGTKHQHDPEILSQPTSFVLQSDTDSEATIDSDADQDLIDKENYQIFDQINLSSIIDVPKWVKKHPTGTTAESVRAPAEFLDCAMTSKRKRQRIDHTIPTPCTSLTLSLASKKTKVFKLQTSISSSQPLHSDHLILSQEALSQFSQSSQGKVQQLLPRLTRIVTRAARSEVITMLKASLCDAKTQFVMGSTQHTFQATTMDSRNEPLKFNITLYNLPEGAILIDYSLKRGDGMAFKRMFRQQKRMLASILDPSSANIPFSDLQLPYSQPD